MTKKTTAACVAIAIGTTTLGTWGVVGRRDGARTAARTSSVNAPAPRKKTMTHRHVDCLASAIWHEAGNQPRSGQVAVAEVILERTRRPAFPDDVCAVLAQPGQFSFLRHGSIPPVPHTMRDEMRAMAWDVAAGRLRSPMRGALFFHADHVRPGWAYRRLGTIGAHVFYAEPRRVTARHRSARGETRRRATTA